MIFESVPNVAVMSILGHNERLTIIGIVEDNNSNPFIKLLTMSKKIIEFPKILLSFL